MKKLIASIFKKDSFPESLQRQLKNFGLPIREITETFKKYHPSEPIRVDDKLCSRLIAAWFMNPNCKKWIERAKKVKRFEEIAR